MENLHFKYGQTVDDVLKLGNFDDVNQGDNGTLIPLNFRSVSEDGQVTSYELSISKLNGLEAFFLTKEFTGLRESIEVYKQILGSIQEEYGEPEIDKIDLEHLKEVSDDGISEILEKDKIVASWTILDESKEFKKIFHSLELQDECWQLKTFYTFNENFKEESSCESEVQIDDDDLEDQEEIKYENEDAYSEQEITSVEEEKKEERPLSEEKTDNKKSLLSLIKEFWNNFGKYVLFLIAFIFVWFFFLKDPIRRTLSEKTKNSYINIIYFCVYFIYTIVACVIPMIISRTYHIFRNNSEKDKMFLTNDNVILNTETKSIWETYKSTFFDKDFGIQNKTRASADLYFNYESVIGSMRNFPWISTFRLIAGSFMGLGILGTFIGFSIGLGNINFQTESSSEMTKGIEALVKNGLATAFNTSIVGVLLSLIYNFFIYNPLIKQLSGYFEHLSDQLDKDFYVSETEALMQYTMLTGENAENITFSQSLRFIVENMNKQTDALNSFNDNLADKIGNMQKTVDGAMQKFGEDAGKTVGDIVVKEVKGEMGDLRTSLSEAAKEFGQIADKVSNTPVLLEKANSELKTYLEDTRKNFSEMLEENLATNRVILDEVVVTVKEQLADQFHEFATSLTKALKSAQKASDLLANTPEKIEQIETMFLEKENEAAEKFDSASNKLSNISDGVTEYLTSMQTGITSILEDLSNAEENVKELLASAKINEENSGKNLSSVIDETNTMLEGFKSVDISLKNIFQSIGEEIVKYNTTVDATLNQYLKSFEDGSKAFSSSISGQVTELSETIDNLSVNMQDVQNVSSHFGESVIRLGDILSQKEAGKK